MGLARPQNTQYALMHARVHKPFVVLFVKLCLNLRCPEHMTQFLSFTNIKTTVHLGLQLSCKGVPDAKQVHGVCCILSFIFCTVIFIVNMLCSLFLRLPADVCVNHFNRLHSSVVCSVR